MSRKDIAERHLTHLYITCTVKELLCYTVGSGNAGPISLGAHTFRVYLSVFCYTVNDNLFAALTSVKRSCGSTLLTSVVVGIGDELTTVADINKRREGEVSPAQLCADRTCPFWQHIADDLVALRLWKTVAVYDLAPLRIALVSLADNVTIAAACIDDNRSDTDAAQSIAGNLVVKIIAACAVQTPVDVDIPLPVLCLDRRAA